MLYAHNRPDLHNATCIPKRTWPDGGCDIMIACKHDARFCLFGFPLHILAVIATAYLDSIFGCFRPSFCSRNKRTNVQWQQNCTLLYCQMCGRITPEIDEEGWLNILILPLVLFFTVHPLFSAPFCPSPPLSGTILPRSQTRA
ncbi:hypothetical protein B0H19DRAFT_562366 [Mycena capillaripes]|nr:hypothetical protein B0H19DRAFT_562366 [Mycena capillaripes]